MVGRLEGADLLYHAIGAKATRLKRNDTNEITGCMNNLGLIAFAHGDDREAEKLFRESVSLWRALADEAPRRVGIDVPLGNLSFVALFAKDLERAERFASESLAVARAPTRSRSSPCCKSSA